MRAATRGGITLLEVLTVLVIGSLVMTIAWAGVAGMQRSGGLVGGAALVADFARQARATAASTGAPVQILIDREARTIAGVSRTPLLDLDFDDNAPPDGAPGFSGRAWTASSDDAPASIAFPAASPLMLKAGDGFYVSALVRPPPVLGAARDRLPIVCLGRSNQPAADGDPASAAVTFARLFLTHERLVIQDRDRDDGSPDDADVTVPHWLPVVELRHGPGSDDLLQAYGTLESDEDFHAKTGEQDYGAPFRTKRHIAPIVGDAWVQLGLLFDGERLWAIRDGVTVASAVVPDTPLAPPAGRGDDAFRVYLAHEEDAAGEVVARGQIDEVRIVRLGTSSPQRFPAGVEPEQHYRILALDGSLRLFARDDPAASWAASNTLRLRHTADDTTARITIRADGTTEVTYP